MVCADPGSMAARRHPRQVHEQGCLNEAAEPPAEIPEAKKLEGGWEVMSVVIVGT